MRAGTADAEARRLRGDEALRDGKVSWAKSPTAEISPENRGVVFVVGILAEANSPERLSSLLTNVALEVSAVGNAPEGLAARKLPDGREGREREGPEGRAYAGFGSPTDAMPGLLLEGAGS